MHNSPEHLISIIMPSLNQATFIESAISSVLSQDYARLELIVTDGGSTDGTLDILRRWQQVDKRLVWFSEPDSGPAEALNRALAKVRGTLIGWLNADDLYLPGTVARSAEAFQANPMWLILYGHGEHIDETGMPLHPYPTLPPDTPFEQFIQGCFICQPTVFFRRTLAEMLGPFDQSLKTAFDFDYWLRAFNSFTGRIGFVDALQAQSRLHKGCITLRQRRTVILEGMQVLSKNFGYAPKEWLLTYMDERLAQASNSQVSDDLRAEMPDMLDSAKPFLAPSDHAVLQEKITQHCLLQQNGNSIVTDSGLTSSTDLIASYPLEQHLKFADDYFSGREGHLYLYQKPFHHTRNSADALSNLGQLLAGLQLDPGMRVLDFAAGSCWLSRILVQMGCQVTCCDASAIALDIGRRLFEQHPPIADHILPPEFVLFNGEQLPHPDETFDRVVVFDAFHHIPNSAAVLKELFRVLKPDGIVAMSEPGRSHSGSTDSQYEMNTFKVIEHDIVLEELWEEARQAGFVDIRVCPVLRNSYLDINQYCRCLNGEIPKPLLHRLVQDTYNHSIFFLHKTPLPASDKSAEKIYSREQFDEAFYLERYPDVAAVVAQGLFTDGWQHYERHGRNEGRRGKAC